MGGEWPNDPYLPGLFHSLLAQPYRQAFACRKGWERGLSVASERRRKFPPITWAHKSLRLRQSQPIFRLTNHKRAMPASRRPCLIPTDSPDATTLGMCSSVISIHVLSLLNPAHHTSLNIKCKIINDNCITRWMMRVRTYCIYMQFNIAEKFTTSLQYFL